MRLRNGALCVIQLVAVGSGGGQSKRAIKEAAGSRREGVQPTGPEK